MGLMTTRYELELVLWRKVKQFQATLVFYHNHQITHCALAIPHICTSHASEG